MTASSQAEEDDEERFELERELAAELAALSAQDVGFDESLDRDDDQNDISGCVDSGKMEVEYVRLDLDMMLKQVISSSTDEVLDLHDHEHRRISHTSWELLLQSVERSDREFFQPYHENLHEIRASIRDVKSPASLPGEQAIELEIHAEPTISQQEQTSLPPVFHENDEQSKPQDNVDEQECSNTGNEKITTGNSIPNVSENLMEQTTDNEPRVIAEMTDTDRIPTPPQASNQLPQAVSVLDVHQSIVISEDNQFGDDQTLRTELQKIAKQHEARELRRLQAQARYEKERDEAAQLLLRLQEELQAQERNAEITRCEARERSLMAIEEICCQHFVAAEREAHEIALMTLADEDSFKFAVELDRMQISIRMEVAQMKAEDQAERHRMQVEQHARHEKQKALARGLFRAVLLDLLKHHEVQRQILDQQAKRERRECVEMRVEETYTRRILAETRAICEKKNRERNRVLMICEDELANALKEQEIIHRLQRLQEENCRGKMEEEELRSHSAWTLIEHLQRMQSQNEERSRFALEQEEKRCRRAWRYLAELAEAEAKERERQLEVDRLRALRSILTGFQRLGRVLVRHKLTKGLEKWKLWHQHCVNEDQIRSAAAATRIQMWHRSCRQRLQQLVSVEPLLVLEDVTDDEEQPQIDEDEEDDDVEELDDDNLCENQEAALRLQSTFRGFHVRRKFANALALAQTVGEHEGDAFDAVDLDDLIQLPPELADGWEDPVLPPTSVLSYLPISQQIDSHQGNFDHVDNNDLEESKSTLKELPKEQNFAMTLWNKMKRAKNRQQHTQQERQRQQDPVYRVQKLLNRKPITRNASHLNGNSSNNQNSHTQGSQKVVNMVSWSSTSNTKKKAKVKLPSLVERLRKQTMAQR
ncbi:Hypothetical protein PHPALM_12163 [Phytophthora palmivora]|uniref:Uncharacterized protein n=1 Tax=Phytophthora palmivora TaxID=4796 RepID=A0A2P4Y0G0_9STRA|nr:Hypothetical protein PHPALM_12163 [Phytophthora palmivora]